jgi:hypothetical protein
MQRIQPFLVVLAIGVPLAGTVAAGEALVVREYAVEAIVRDHPDFPAPHLGGPKGRRCRT